jgi:hypothetical protein
VAALDLGASADDAALAEALAEALDDADASVREAAARSLSAAAGPEILHAVRLDPSIRRREVRRIVAALHPVSQANSSAPLMVSGSIDRRLGSIQRTLTAIAQGRRSVTPAPAAAVQPSALPAMPTTPTPSTPPPVTPAPAEIPRPEREIPAAAAAPEVTSTEAPPAEEISGEALNSAIISRVYGALRGQTAEGLAKALRLGADTIRPAVEKLVQEGRIVRRGTRYFVP